VGSNPAECAIKGYMTQSENINFVFLLVVGTALLISVITSRRHSSQPLLQYALVWVGIFLMLTLAYSFKDRITAVILPSKAIKENGHLVFLKSSDGHFHVDAIVNGAKIRFIVDTGATDLVLSPEDAGKIGYKLSELKYDRLYVTANGMVKAASILITSIEIGGVQFRDVDASINSAPMQSSLLGMSFLERLEYYKFQDDQLILKY
jgi:aspartyl protease family protein